MPRKQHTHHYIYKTTCKVNGKYYVGMHSTSNLEDGYIGSGKRLWNSIKKHGRENHSIEILEWFPDRSSLKNREKELVNESLLQDPMCMNLAIGGEGGFRNTEAARAGGRSKNRDLTPAYLAFRKKWNEDKIFREEIISRSNLTKIERYGSKNAWFGKKHSEETIEKFRKSKAGHGKGESNSQYGKMWITNGVENLSILKTDSIPEGWKRGRKIR
jgi:hypothetical protein